MLVSNPAKLEEICVKCGSRNVAHRVQRTFSYANPTVFLWIILSPLVLLIAWWLSAKRLKLTFSRCDVCNRKILRWKRFMWVNWAVFVLSLGLIYLLGAPPEGFMKVTMAITLGSFVMAIYAWYIVSNDLRINKMVGLGFDLNISKEIEERMLELKLESREADV